MNLLKCLSLITIVALAGCLIDSDEKLQDEGPVSAYLIKNATVSDRSISIVVTCETPNPCYCFTHTKHSRSANSYQVKVFARLITNDPCIHVVGSIDAPFNVTVESPGSYSFRFWRYDGTTVDTTLVVQ